VFFWLKGFGPLESMLGDLKWMIYGWNVDEKWMNDHG